MSDTKRGRPTNSIKDYMLRVRLSEEEIKMLDLLCHVDNKSRSELIRHLIVSAIYSEYANTTNNNNYEEIHLKIKEQEDLINYLEKEYPLKDAIDKK